MTDNKRTGDLDDILTRAVDRQIAEQRALRQSLDELRDSVRELVSRPAPKADRPGTPSDLTGLEERIRNAIQSSVHGASETTFASLSDQLRSFRESVVPRLEQSADMTATVRSLGEDVAGVREVVGGVSNDLEGIAQALIDFNSGISRWASGMDETVSSIRLTVGELYAVSTQPARTAGPDTDAKSDDKDEEGAKDGKAAQEGEGKPSEITERIKETAELSEYLADQIEDLDGLMGRLTELPQQLEGVVSQALKRTLTARAKLDREAETAIDDVLEALDEQVNELSAVIARFEQEEDHIRKLALEQVELSSRVESLQEVFVDRIDRFDDNRRRSEEAIAVALDRSARGLQPRALESLAKSTKRRKVTPPAPRKRKAKATATGRKADAKSTANRRKEPTRKAKRSTPRKSRRPDWTPLPGDDTSA
jgi:uncharacterized protein YoxC